MFMRATKQVAVCGAVGGGLLVASAAFGGYRGTILTTLVAMVSAVLLTLLAGFVNGRRIYARQLYASGGHGEFKCRTAIRPGPFSSARAHRCQKHFRWKAKRSCRAGASSRI